MTKLWKITYNLKRVLDYATDDTKTDVNKNPHYSKNQYQALTDVLAYAQDESKTERELFVDGINCDPSNARETFIGVKNQFGKPDGIQAYHGYISFKEQNISPELAHKVGMEFARRVWGERFQIVVTTHMNTRHLHCHYVINSVSFRDGKMLHGDEKAWIKFRHIADDVCREFGLYYNPQPDNAKQNSYYHRKEEVGIPTRYSIVREQLDAAIEQSRSISEFKYHLEQMGYRYQFNYNRKYWTVIPKGYEKPIRLYKLGEEYTNEAIMRRLDENYQKLRFYPFQEARVVLRCFTPSEQEEKIKKVGGLYGLYLHYCYKLGYFSKEKKVSAAEINYIFREDWLRLDTISEQARLLGREHISTIEQLYSYRDKVDTEINTLIADRKLLRNKTKRKIDDKELSKAKEQISVINGRLKTLRKERKLCDGIAERSGQMQSNLAIALAEEEKTQKKEVRSNEQRW